MRCNPLALVINLERGICHPQIDFLSRILIRAGIPVLLVDDMIVEIYSPVLIPGGDFKRKVRKRMQVVFLFLPGLVTVSFPHTTGG